MAFGFGSKDGSTVPFASTCARLFLATPPTVVKLPARYHPPAPSGAASQTSPSTYEYGAARRPVVTSSGTAAPVAVATHVNEPPRYVVPSSPCAIAHTVPSVRCRSVQRTAIPATGAAATVPVPPVSEHTCPFGAETTATSYADPSATRFVYASSPPPGTARFSAPSLFTRPRPRRPGARPAR